MGTDLLIEAMNPIPAIVSLSEHIKSEKHREAQGNKNVNGTILAPSGLKSSQEKSKDQKNSVDALLPR